MLRSTAFTAAALIGSAALLSGYSGGGRVKNGPATVPYACEDGRQASAIYEHGGDFHHAKVMLTFDGRTTELEAAPTLYGMRYRSEATPALVWSIRGETALLAEANDPHDVTDEGRPIARCTRLRRAAAGHGAGHDGEAH